MTMDPSTRVDRVLPELFVDLAEARTPAYLEAAIERASSRPQRPAWTYPGRWLPVQVTTEALPTARGLWGSLGVLALIGGLIALATVAYVGSQPARPDLTAPPFGLAGNGVIALAKDGDILVADRLGGDTRPLVAGPELDERPMFSPDGTRLAFLRQTELGSVLMVADADGTNVVQLTPETLLDASKWSFAPDGRSLVGVAEIDGEPDGPDSELGNTPKRVLIRPVDPATGLTVLDIQLWDSSMELSWWEGPGFRPTNPQEILVVAQLDPGGRRGIYVYDLATGGIRTILEPAGDRYVYDVAWLPDGEHIIYRLEPGGTTRVVAADGSGDQAFDALRGRISPLSNDGTRVVADRDIFKFGEADTHPGDDSYLAEVVVQIDGDGEPVELACGLGMKIECAWSWIWSPDDSMLIGTVPHEGPSTYLQADPDTGQVTELDWRDLGTPAWQRVAP